MEQIIVFAYDTEYCQHEADDPQKAVLFFYPNWVSEQQRLALCGQLMGATHFCSSIFSAPSILTLQSGKFLLKKFGRYILSVGSDQSLPDWILKERFKAFQSLIEFYHCDLYTIAESVGDHEEFIKRLGQIFDIYIPVLQSVVSAVGSVPSLHYNNGNSSVFLEALQLLEACSGSNQVPGGLILHNGKVVVSQVSANINLLACLTDPYRVKSCAKTITVPFHLPIGVQLFKVFVKSSLLSVLNKKPQKNSEQTRIKKVSGDNMDTKQVAKMFTVPEEEEESNRNEHPSIDIIPLKESSYLNLKLRRNSKLKPENNILKERSKSYRANPNISVCSTPTVEKKLIHEDILSICSGKLDPKLPPVPDLVQDVLNRQPTPQYKSSRRISMDDLMIDLTQKTFPVPLKYYSVGLPRINKVDKSLARAKAFKTLTDSMYPVFRDDGLSISKGLYTQLLDEHYNDYLIANKTIDCHEEYVKSKQLEMKKEKKKLVIEELQPITTEKKADQKLLRRPMSLDITPMVLDGSNQPSVKSKILHGLTPTTPLMAKLSVLAMEENPRITTDSKQIDLPLPSCLRRIDEKSSGEEENRQKKKREEAFDEENSTLVPCTLFVCGQGNMTLFLVLDENAEQDPDLILNLWELATNNLDRVESAWNRSMDHVTQVGGSNSYSFLSMDPVWGTVRKYGAWGNDELRIVGSLHQDMLQTTNITEMIVRSEESVVYGYRCGGTETYYQQAGSSSIGLPTPADLMGVITLKARRRLERDHGVILL